MNLADPITLFIVFSPYLAVAFIITNFLLLLLLVLIPGSAWKIFKLKYSSGKSLGLIANDDGILNFELLSNLPQGIFKSSVKDRRYFFLPRPSFRDEMLATDSKGQVQLFNEAERMVMDEAMLKRHVIGDVKKPVYIGYSGKCVVAGPALLNEIEKSDKLEAAAKELDIPVEELKKKLETDKAKLVKKEIQPVYLNLLDPRKWKQYIKLNFSQSAVEALCRIHEDIGRHGKPRSFPVWIIIVVLLVVVGVIAFVAMGGLNMFQGLMPR